MKERKVLIVDDEKNIRMTLSQTLADMELSIETAINGEEALAKSEGTKFDILFLDLKMPGMDGMEVLRQIKDSQPDVKVIIITAHGSIEIAVEAMKLGAVDFLQKPYTPNEIRELVSTIIKREYLISKEPQDYRTYVEYAKKSIAERQFDLAIQYIKKAIAMDYDHAEAFNILGALYEIMGDIAEAQKNYRMALSIDPTYEPAEKNLYRSTRLRSGDSIIFNKNE